MDSEVLDDFRQTIGQYHGRLLSITDAQAEMPKHPGEWSPKEIVGHLIDSAANNHQRFIRAQFTDDLMFTGYDQENWVRVQHYHQEPWYDLVQLWRRYNLHLVHIVSFIPEDVLQRPRAKHNLDQIAWQRVSVDQPTTLDYLIRDYIGHMKEHLHQVVSP